MSPSKVFKHLTSDQDDMGNFHVKILNRQLTKDYNDNKAVVVNFKFTNNSTSAATFLFSTNVTAYQDGAELDIAFIMDQSLYDAGLAQKKIKPSESLVVQSAFVLSSDNPLVI